MKVNLPGGLAGAPRRKQVLVVGGIVVAVLAAGMLFGRAGEAEKAPVVAPAQKNAGRPALSVTLTQVRQEQWPQTLSANGNVVAWQEAVISPEISNYRITEVRAQVGDVVKKGQVLARIASDTVGNELAEAKAVVAELEATSAEAKSNAARAAELKAKGFYSTQLNTQYETAAHTAGARLAAARARLQAAQIRMNKTSVLAPDNGVISARSAVVGSLTQTGQELFRLIRGGRLEWRAELPSAELGRVKVGGLAMLTSPGGALVKGTVRSVAPSVDPATRNGLVYVDLPAGSSVWAGMFARGQFELGATPALTLPQSAIVLREGFAYAFTVGADSRVAQVKVQTGRRQGERVEVLSGLVDKAQVVATGTAFLADGDLVKVVNVVNVVNVVKGGTP